MRGRGRAAVTPTALLMVPSIYAADQTVFGWTKGAEGAACGMTDCWTTVALSGVTATLALLSDARDEFAQHLWQVEHG